jgi:hypothetical protein
VDQSSVGPGDGSSNANSIENPVDASAQLWQVALDEVTSASPPKPETAQSRRIYQNLLAVGEVVFLSELQATAVVPDSQLPDSAAYATLRTMYRRRFQAI